MVKMVQKIIEKLEEYDGDVKIKDNPNNKDAYSFMSDYSILVYKVSEKKLYVSFNAATDPTSAAFQILVLRQIRGLDIEISEPFFHEPSEDGSTNLVTGHTAVRAFERELTNDIIKDFIEKQKQLHLLHSVEGYHC